MSALTTDERDRVREALGARAGDVEAVEVLSETHGEALPAAARERLGMLDGQKNVLLRVVLRAHGRNLTDAEANEQRIPVHRQPPAAGDGEKGDVAMVREGLPED